MGMFLLSGEVRREEGSRRGTLEAKVVLVVGSWVKMTKPSLPSAISKSPVKADWCNTPLGSTAEIRTFTIRFLNNITIFFFLTSHVGFV